MCRTVMRKIEAVISWMINSDETSGHKNIARSISQPTFNRYKSVTLVWV